MPRMTSRLFYVIALASVATGNANLMAQPATGSPPPGSAPATAAAAPAAASPAPVTPAPTAPATAPAAAPVAGSFSVVVTRDDLPLRSGPATLHYPVANLKSGTVLRVEGEDSGYFRVAYPPGLRAFVRAEDVSVDASGKTAKLQRASLLRAANLAAGDRGSWYPLLQRELPAGTELSVLESIKGEDGKATMFAVAAPAEARGFVVKDFVRRLSDSEAVLAGSPITPPAPSSGATPATGAASNAAAPTSGEPGRLVPVDGTGTPGTTPPVLTMESAPATPTTPQAAPAKADRSQSLQMLFRRVQAQPAETAELEDAIAQFDAYLSSAPADGRGSRQLMGMLDVLRLRKDTRDRMRQSESSNAELAREQASLTQQIAQLEKQAVYRAIGRLMPSLVFDGVDLPKLYRIVSPEPGTARTIGYVAPAPGLDLEGKVNRIVGVVGESRLDEAVRANIITPVRVDVLNIQPAASTPATPGGTVLPGGSGN